MTIYVFDMDGTLTPARLPMEKEFSLKFIPWLKSNKAYIATGSNLPKVEEQIGLSIMNEFTGIYCSMGNELWVKGKYEYQNDFTPDTELLNCLEKYRKNTKYPYKLFPNYIEKRVGMINFSVLGRECPYDERLRYQAWDKENGERVAIATELKEKFPQYEFCVGGSISMDIIPVGCSKAQIATKLREKYPEDKIVFFGDKTFVGGNDFELAKALRKLDNTEVVQVESPADVLKYLNL